MASKPKTGGGTLRRLEISHATNGGFHVSHYNDDGNGPYGPGGSPTTHALGDKAALMAHLNTLYGADSGAAMEASAPKRAATTTSSSHDDDNDND